MSKRVSVDDCRIIQLPKHMQESGSITVVENNHELPFAVKRVYYLYDVPGGEERGGHSHKQPITACSSCRVSGVSSTTFRRARCVWC